MINWFGPQSWGAPVCETAPRCEIPIGETCVHCDLPIRDGDYGVTMPLVGDVTAGACSFHLACLLDSIGVQRNEAR